jgi:hypothetical protein
VGQTKTIAVIARDRQSEALRISCGLTLADNTVEVFLLDLKLDKNDPAVAQPLELVGDLGLTVYSTNPGNGFTGITIEEMARKLLEYDIVVPY